MKRILLNVEDPTDLVILGLKTKSENKITFATEPTFFNIGFEGVDNDGPFVCIRHMGILSDKNISILTFNDFKSFVNKIGVDFLEFFDCVLIKDYKGNVKYHCSINGKSLETSDVFDKFIIDKYNEGATVKPTIVLSYDAKTILLNKKNINKHLELV